MKKIAVIGAGMAGISFARALQPSATITLFDKSRGIGGRLSTRRAGDYAFDHGAQFFTARSEAFQQTIQPLVAQGIVAAWNPIIASFDGATLKNTTQWQHPHYVGVPGMSAVGKALAEGLDVHRQTRIAAIKRAGDGWRLADDQQQDLGCFDWVVSAAPAEQTAALMPSSFAHQAVVTGRHMQPSFALMLGFQQPLALDFDVAKVTNSAVSWLAVNSSKPGRKPGYSVLVHADHQWAAQHLEEDREAVIAALCDHTSRLLGHDVATANHIDLHRWRYAIIDPQQGSGFLLDRKQRLAACGDWCVGGRVEAAFQSGIQLAEALSQ